MIGKIFADRYRLIETLGTGGMSHVYKGEDQVLGRQVAVKILAANLSGDAVFVERFRREAQAVAKLNHPNIVSIFDWGEQDGLYYLVMEYLEGHTLKELIAEKGKLSEVEIVNLSLQITAALSHAHAEGLIHRDIKPQNLIVLRGGQLKVTDFGIARTTASDATVTAVGTILGTAQYFSPEQAQGQVAGRPSDIYSLGVVMYEMASGNPPFQGENPIATALMHVNDNPVPLHELDSGIDSGLEAIILKAMAKDPEARYHTAEELATDMLRLKEGKQVLAPAVSSENTQVLELGNAKRKPKWPWIALALVLLALGIGAYSYGGGRSGTQAEVPRVAGLSLQEAVDLLKKNKLKPDITKVFNNEVKSGTVISQDPEEGVKLEEGDVVKLKVSQGKEMIEVPDIRGVPPERAGFLLARSRLELGETHFEFSTWESGQIFSQLPKPGEKVAPGEPINIWVSKGEELIRVPDLRNMTGSEALEALKAKSLRMEEESEYSEEVEEGRVIRQSPSADEEVPKLTQVRVVISKGPREETINVPDVRDMPVSAAENRLRELDLIPVIQYKESSSYSPGTVIAQNPSPGANVEKNQKVLLVVAKQPSTSSFNQ